MSKNHSEQIEKQDATTQATAHQTTTQNQYTAQTVTQENPIHLHHQIQLQNTARDSMIGPTGVYGDGL